MTSGPDATAPGGEPDRPAAGVREQDAPAEAAALPRAQAKELAAQDRATAKLVRERDAWTARLERERATWAAKLEQEREKGTAKLERERETAAARIKRISGELSELQKSYHLSGAAKKLDLRELDDFAPIAGEIVAAGRTGMNYDRLYTLWQAVRAIPNDDPVIEIGSYLGGSARFISEVLQASGRTPRFYVCDTFAGHADTDSEIDTSHHGTGKFEDASAEATGSYLAGYPALELVVGDIVGTSAQLPAENYGFVHLDVDVYPTTHYCLRFFAPRLAENAVMILDDYGVITCPGVKRAADEFVAEFAEYRLWHLLSGQAILSRIASSS